MGDGADTIAAIATPPGRGGVAVVRVSGPAAFSVAAALAGCAVSAAQAGRFFHARFSSQDGKPIDDGLVLVFAAPRSYTGEDVVELQCHGGSVSPRRVLEACLAAGARLARRGEFTQRAFLNGRLALSEAEAVIDLIDAKTDRAADEARARLDGRGNAEMEAIYSLALSASAQLEHSLDFSEEELPCDFADSLMNDIHRLLDMIDRSLSSAREGRLLREGALVVLAGPPNAGKSSLMNALLDENRVIVSPSAGTTRDSVEESINIGGWPVRLVDTAGIRTSADMVESEGVDRAMTLVAKADLVLALCPADTPDCGEGWMSCLDIIPPERILRVCSKCDLAYGERAGNQGVAVSSFTGEGLDALRSEIRSRLERFASKSGEPGGADVTTRQKECLMEARMALCRADVAIATADWVIAANEVRSATDACGRMLGRTYSEDILDSVFSRFCIGK